MKANELMVGDLLYDKANDYYGEVTGVIDNGEIYIDGVIAYIDDCTPIPLTQEILEKNGFKKCEGNEWSVFKYKDDDHTKNALYLVLWSADELYLEICSYTSNTGDFNRIGIRYVHELQHALKLCGIDKTIEL